MAVESWRRRLIGRELPWKMGHPGKYGAYGAAARTHGRSGSHSYKAWQALKSRCKRKQEPLDPRWRKFEAFSEDMGRRPDKGHLRRLDSTKPWGPGNAAWVLED